MPRFHRRTAAVIAAFAATAAPAAGASAASCPATEPASSASVIRQLAGLRASLGLPALRVRTPITRPARSHSADMASTGRLWHDDLARWASGSAAAQNVASGSNARMAFAAMVQSRPHRLAMLNRRFRYVGVGAVRGCDGMLMVTVNLLGPVRG